MFPFELKNCHFHLTLRYNPIVNDTGISLKCYFKHSHANELSILASVLKQSFEKTAQVSSTQQFFTKHVLNKWMACIIHVEK